MTSKTSNLLDRLVPLPEGQRSVARGLNATELPMEDRINLVQGGRASLVGPERDASVRREGLEGARTGLAMGATGVLGTGVASHLADRAASMADDSRLDMATEVLFRALSPDGKHIPSNVANHLPFAFEATDGFRPSTQRTQDLLETEAIRMRDQLKSLDVMEAEGRMAPNKATQVRNQVVAKMTGRGAPKSIPKDLTGMESLLRGADPRFRTLQDPGALSKGDLSRFLRGPLRSQHGSADDVISDLNRGFVQYLTNPEPKHNIFQRVVEGRKLAPLEHTLLENKLRPSVEKAVGPGGNADRGMRKAIDAVRKDPALIDDMPWMQAQDQMSRLEGNIVGQSFKDNIRDPLRQARRFLAEPLIPSTRHAPAALLQKATKGGFAGTVAGTIAAKGLQALLSRGGVLAGLGGVAGGVAGVMKQRGELEGMLEQLYKSPEDVRAELEAADQARAEEPAEHVEAGRPLRDSIPRLRKSIRGMSPDFLAELLQTATAVDIGMPGLA